MERDFENTRPFSLVSRREFEDFFEESRRSRQEMLDSVAALTLSVKDVKENLETFKSSTQDLVTVFNSLKGLSNILIWIGKIMKPLIWLAGIITAVNLYFNGVKIPKFGP